MNWDNLFFGQMPYLFLTIAIVGTIYRYMANRFSWSSQSSQFLEDKTLFYGSPAWHYGIILVLLAHIAAIFFPGALLAWNSAPVRLYAIEITGLSLGFLALFGLFVIIYRRLSISRVRVVTSSWDILILIVLVIQVVTGIGNAILYKWGTNWYAASAVPWIWSIFTLNPKVQYVESLPLLTKIHIFNALIFIGLIPLTRFVHFLAFIGPIKYITRPYQVVRWYNRDEKTATVKQLS
jgi:nitrate reductase gamma subunit